MISADMLDNVLLYFPYEKCKNNIFYSIHGSDNNLFNGFSNTFEKIIFKILKRKINIISYELIILQEKPKNCV